MPRNIGLTGANITNFHPILLDSGLANAHPFDDPAVIAGQGTIALEILQQVSRLEAVVVLVGGGGLLAGVATVTRALSPETKVFGVEPEQAACFSSALQRGDPVRIRTGPTLADGLAVAQTGQRTFQIAAPLVDRVVTVNEQELANAITRIVPNEFRHPRTSGARASGFLFHRSGAYGIIRLPLCGRGFLG